MSPEVARRVNAERLVVLGWSRAILLQLAHPLVAAGVGEHSTYRNGPIVAAGRLRQTVRAMLSLTFDSDVGRSATLERIRAIHRRVHGTLKTTCGPWPAGTPYSAEDPELLTWVHATLVESVVLLYERTVGPLSPDERDAYCGGAAEVTVALGADRASVPDTWTALGAYLDRMLASGGIIVGPEARSLAAAVLNPAAGTPWQLALGPLSWANRLVTHGLLPPDVRAQYHVEWDARRARRLEFVLAALTAGRRVAPRVLREWAVARRSGRGTLRAPER